MNREPTLTEYFLTVSATDSGSPAQSSSTTVLIKLPYNHPPIIKGPNVAQVLENADNNTFVTKVIALDKFNDTSNATITNELTYVITNKKGNYWKR